MKKQRWRMAAETVMVMAAIYLIFALVSQFLFGPSGYWVATIAVVLILLFGPKISPAFILKMQGARLLSPAQAPDLYRLLDKLAERAQIPVCPQIYYIPSPLMNALTMGSTKTPVMAVTDGLLRRLSRRELIGVLAHEVAHIRNRDLWLMTLTGLIRQSMAFFAIFGGILSVTYLPVALLYDHDVPWLSLLLIFIAPSLILLLQMKLSRTREFSADLEAVHLTGDADGLASALSRIRRFGHTPFMRFFQQKEDSIPTVFKSHPDTEERVNRLLALKKRKPRTPLDPLLKILQHFQSPFKDPF